MSYTLETAKIIFYLALVLGLIYLLAGFFKKRLTMGGNSQYITVLERSFPMQKTALTLVKVKDRVYLLGISEGGFEVLDKWPLEEFGELRTEQPKDFKDHLEDFIKGIRPDRNE